MRARGRPAEEKRVARLERRREAARRELLDAARIVVGRGGVPALTIEAVATEAGVSKPAVYYYFADKEALLRSVVVDLAHREIETVTEAVRAAPDGRSAVVALVRAFARHHLDDLGAFQLAYVWSQIVGVGDDVDAVVNPRMNALFDVLESKLVADRAAGRLAEGAHPRRLAVVTWFAAFGFVSAQSLAAATGTRIVHRPDALLEELAGVLERGTARAKK